MAGPDETRPAFRRCAERSDCHASGGTRYCRTAGHVCCHGSDEARGRAYAPGSRVTWAIRECVGATEGRPGLASRNPICKMSGEGGIRTPSALKVLCLIPTCPRTRPRTRKPGHVGRVTTDRSWLSSAERDSDSSRACRIGVSSHSPVPNAAEAGYTSLPATRSMALVSLSAPG